MKKLTIEQVKKIELEMLNYFHKFCEENNLIYYLAFGTLLGAVRHKGFIPWDDDIDVYMPREDYEKLIKIFDSKNNHLTLFCIDNNIQYYLQYAKLVKDNTIVLNKQQRNIGISIDIFPLDNLSNSYNKSLFLIKIVNSLRIIKDSKLFSYDKTRVKKFIHTIMKYIFFFIPTRFLVVQINNLSKKYKKETNSKYIGYVASATKKPVLKREWFEERVLLDFENYKFWAPKGWDKVLKNNYGNYMVLPSEKQRINHSVEAYLKEE